MYLSPGRYRAAGFGLDVQDIEDAELRAVLVRASSLVDVYCGIPMQPSRHNFSGGAITGEQHEWRLATDIAPGARRVYINHRPISTVTGFRVMFTNSYRIEIDPANLFINRIQGWVEVVSLAAVVSGIYPIGVNFGLYTPVAEIDYTYGFDISEIDEQMYVTDGNTYQAARGNWKADPAPVIKLNDVVITTGFTISPVDGEVVFDSPNAAEDVVTATYDYSLPDAIAEATGIVATHLLGERSLAAKGMSNLSSIKVAEVALMRTNRGLLGMRQNDSIPEQAASLLAPFAFRSVG